MISLEDINEIVLICDQLPEKYQEKCFELLLFTKLQNSLIPLHNTNDEVIKSPPAAYTLPIDVRAFLSQYQLSEDLVYSFFFIEGDQIRPIYKIEESVKSKAQISTALLLAFESTLRGGNFQTSVEELRTKCRELGILDAPNFAANIRKNGKFFKNAEEDTLELSSEGKSELAEVLEQMAK